MGVLTIPYRLFYRSSYGVRGLTDVQVVVLKPDNTVAGPFRMVDAPMPFIGRYIYDYISTSSDPEGEYAALIVCPSEQDQDNVRFDLYKGALSPSILAGMSAVKGFVKMNQIIGEVEPVRPIRGYVEIPLDVVGVDEGELD